MATEYKWDSPLEWLLEQAQTWDKEKLMFEFQQLAPLLDSDQLQDLYQSDMDASGYFKPLRRKKQSAGN